MLSKRNEINLSKNQISRREESLYRSVYVVLKATTVEL
jgi:hypothetical protein